MKYVGQYGIQIITRTIKFIIRAAMHLLPRYTTGLINHLHYPDSEPDNQPHSLDWIGATCILFYPPGLPGGLTHCENYRASPSLSLISKSYTHTSCAAAFFALWNPSQVFSDAKTA
eukprot:362189-Chlamydomonas_euryale.AAC.2